MDRQKRIALVVVVVLIVIGVGIFYTRSWMQNQTVPVTVIETIKRPELNFEFSFPSGEKAYSYIEPAIAADENGNAPEAAFLMLNNEAYIAFQDPSFVGETPPAMSIFVYQKLEEATTGVASTTQEIDRATMIKNWAVQHTKITSISLAKTEPEYVDIDGTKALHYKADGLYQQDMYIVYHRNRYYLIVGQYNAESDPIYNDFQNLIKSIYFM